MKKLTLLLLLACTTMFAQTIALDGPEEIFVNEAFPLEVTLHNVNSGNTAGIGVGFQFREIWSTHIEEWQTPKQKALDLTNATIVSAIKKTKTVNIKIYNGTPRTVEIQLFFYRLPVPGFTGGDGIHNAEKVGSKSNIFRYHVRKLPQSDPLQPEKPKDTFFVFEDEIYVTGTPAPPPTISDPSDPWSPPVIDDSCPVGADGQMLKITKIYGIDGKPLNPNINALRVTTSGEIKIAFDIARFKGLDDGATAYHEYINLAKSDAEWKRSPARNVFNFTIQTATGTKTHTIPAYTDEFIIGEECEDELRELLLADIHKPGPRAVRLVVGDYTSTPFEFVIGQEEYVCEGEGLTINLVGKLKRNNTVKLKVTNLTGYNLGYSYIHLYGDNESLSGPILRIADSSSCVKDYVLKITPPNTEASPEAVLVRVFPLKEGLTEADWKDTVIKL